MVPSDFKAEKKEVLNILFQSEDRLTAQAYIKKIKTLLSVSFFEAKKIVQKLIDDQELCYNYIFGSTYVEQSFLKPVSITNHFVLKPPGFHGRLSGNDIDIIIAQGISFGSGCHPTTRLCLEAIEFCLFEKQMFDCNKNLKGADIGTGSGVLAMAMCLAGLASCQAYEIDPVSINEAKKNIELNCLEKKISLIENTMEKRENRFSIICANLRPPTLTALSDLIHESLKNCGVAIISGVRQWEKTNLINMYLKNGLELIWQRDTKKWSAFVLIKKIC
ncbi:MAG: methyltransferase [Desulfobacula sp.]|nr:methyltransferase [Desulfobacula sp.]